MKKYTYLLWHVHTDEALPGGEDSKLLGTFSSHKKAEEAQAEAAMLEGFRDNLEGFHISEYELDKRQWTSGFAAISSNDAE